MIMIIIMILLGGSNPFRGEIHPAYARSPYYLSLCIYIYIYIHIYIYIYMYTPNLPTKIIPTKIA